MDASKRNVALWSGVLAGPVVWAIALEAKFALVGYVCAHHAAWMLWLISIAALLVIGFGALCSWNGWVDDTQRVRFMAIGGLAINAMFALAIIAMAVPDLFLRPCE